MASRVYNICTKNYQNLLIGFQVTVENVRDTFLRHSVVSYLCCLLNFHVIFINLVRSKLTQAYYYHVVAVSEKDVFCIYFTIAFTSNFVIFLSSICDDFEF